LKIFLIAGGANNGNYQFPSRLLKKDLNEALLVIPHMSRADADKFMVKAGLSYKDICTLAEDKYRSLSLTLMNGLRLAIPSGN
jgi:hypothetical protein